MIPIMIFVPGSVHGIINFRLLLSVQWRGVSRRQRPGQIGQPASLTSIVLSLNSQGGVLGRNGE